MHWKYAENFGIITHIVMKYAVIQTGGKQYRVSEGDVIEVERLTSKPTESVTFGEVLLYVADGDVKVGMPYVAGMSVAAEVVADMRGPKIRVSKFKAKARYRRTTGHRQSLSQLKITQIGSEKAAKPTPNTEEPTQKVEASVPVTKKKAVAKKK
jgi:large subunit ribosomal protein L21